MAKTYISGKIAGMDPIESRKLFVQGCFYAYRKRELPINPWGIKPLLGIKKYGCHMIADIWQMLKCDKILLLPNWEDSKGARIEFGIALLFNKEFEYYDTRSIT